MKLKWEAHKSVIYVYLFMIPLFCLLHIYYMEEWAFFYNIKMSAADALCMNMKPFFLGFIVQMLSLFEINYSMKYDFDFKMILAIGDKRKVFFRQILKMSNATLLLSAYVMLCSFLVGIFRYPSLINWGEQSSIYSFMNKSLNVDTSLAKVVLLFYIMTVLNLLLVNIFAVFFWWIFDNLIFIWIFVLGIRIFDSKFEFLYGILSVKYTLWEQNVFLRNSLMAFALILLLIFIGSVCVKRKEFR